MESKPQTTFLTKLYALLERPEYQSMIRWDANGEQIIVERSQEFALHVLSSLYHQSSFASFSRQLNIYGFVRKVSLCDADPDDPDASTWAHPTLTRNTPPEVVANFEPRVHPGPPKQQERGEAGIKLPPFNISPHQALPPHHHLPTSSGTTHLDVSEISLRSTLDELTHLRITSSRLTIMDSSEVGAGRYGEVLLAVLDGSSQTPTLVAVKELRTVGTRGVRKRVALRLARELKIWAKANHPHVLQLVGYYLSDNYEIAQLISPFMTNGNVSQYLEKLQVSVLERMDIIRGITLGMDYLHSCSPPICHGDLKPTNVLMNDSLQAVLCDFGLASFVEESSISTGLTTSRSIKGSIRYMSPELHLEEDVKHTLESDIWAWGCTSFEIVTDCAPYHGIKGDSGIIMAFIREDPPGSTETLMDRLVEETPTNTSSALQNLPDCLTKCWAFDRKQRPRMPSILRRVFQNANAKETRMVAEQSEDRPGGESHITTPVPEDSIDDIKSGPILHFSPELPQHSPTKWQSRSLHLKRPSPLFLGIPTAPSNQVPDTPFSPISPAVEEHASTPVLQRTFRRRAWELAKDKNLREVIRSIPIGTIGYRQIELNNFRPVHALLSQRPIGRDMHFSPDGTYLAVSQADGMVAIWKVDNFGEYPITIPAPTERFAWSPDSAYIVSILPKGFQIWNRNKRKFVTPPVPYSIGPVAWLHHGDMFAAAVDGEVHVYNRKGRLEKEFKDISCSRLQIHDIAAVPSTNYDLSPGRKFGTLLLAGTVVAEVADPSSGKAEFQGPREAKPERRLIVYNMDWNGLEQARASVEATILADIQEVAVNRNGMFGLLSYGDGSPPELWQLRDSEDRVRLELCRVYDPATTGSADRAKAIAPRVVGKARFGGENDEWVIACNGKNEIYVWNRVTGRMLHTLRSNQIQEFASGLGAYDLSTFACRTVKDNATGMVLASASSSGDIIIWQPNVLRRTRY